MTKTPFEINSLWRQLTHSTDQLQGRCSHTISEVCHQLYIIGGGYIADNSNRYTHCNDIHVYDIQDGICRIEETCGAYFTGRRGHSAVVYRDRWIIVFGGFIQLSSGAIDYSNDLYVYDTVNKRWHVPTLRSDYHPPPRRGHAAAIYEDMMIVVGGDSHSLSLDCQSVFMLDISTLKSCEDEESTLSMEWSVKHIRGIPTQLSLFAYTAIDSNLYIFGGTYIDFSSMQYQTTISSDLFCFHMDTLHVSNLTEFVEWDNPSDHAIRPRFCAGSTRLGSNSMVIWGGTSVLSENLDELLVFTFEFSDNTNDVNGKQQHTCIRGVRCSQNEASARSPIPSARNGSCITSFKGGYIFVMGGGVFPSKYHSDSWILKVFSTPSGSLFKRTLQFNCGGDEADSALSQYCSSLYPDMRYADVVLYSQYTVLDSCGSNRIESIPAHRIVLAAHSSYFRSLFDGGWAESYANGSSESSSSGSNKIVVEAKPTALKMLVQWMYMHDVPSGELYATGDSVVDLLECANMLGVKGCKVFCENAIISSLLQLNSRALRGCSVDESGVLDDYILQEQGNALNALTVAEEYYCDNLMISALEHLRTLQFFILCRIETCYDDDSSLRKSLKENQWHLFFEKFQNLMKDMSSDLKSEVEAIIKMF